MTLENLKIVNPDGGIQATNTKTGADFYIEPGSVLHDLAEAGQLGVVAPYVPEPDPVDPPKYPTPQAALEAMAAWVDGFVAPMTGGVPQAELISWPYKGPAAEAYKAGTASPDQIDMIEGEAAITGEDPGDLADAIIAKAGPSRIVASRVAGLRRKITAQIEAEADPYKFEVILLTAKAEAVALAKSLGLSAALNLE